MPIDRTTACAPAPNSIPSMSDLLPGQSITLPLPPVYLGRRVAYQRIQRDAYALFGAGGYSMKADGPAITVTRHGAGGDGV